MTTLQVTAADGRVLDAQVHGPDGAPLVLVQHGTPGGRGLAAPLVAAADALGLRLASWARPGYGGSTRLPGRSVADVVPDALAVADALGAQRFAVTGASGGGPHALAIGALTDRCAAVATVASVAPWDAEGLDVTAGMGEGNLEEFGAARRGEAELRPMLETWRREVVEGGVDGMLAVLSSVVSPPDAAVLTGDVAAQQYAEMAGGLVPGCDGWLDDDLAFLRPWGVPLTDLRVPVHVWQGGQDLMVPPAHGAWLAAHVPGATAHLLADDGHLTLQVTRPREVLEPLAQALR